jgi:hypothetical protein
MICGRKAGDGVLHCAHASEIQATVYARDADPIPEA